VWPNSFEMLVAVRAPVPTIQAPTGRASAGLDGPQNQIELKPAIETTDAEISPSESCESALVGAKLFLCD
jgi:hypothetical protein